MFSIFRTTHNKNGLTLPFSIWLKVTADKSQERNLFKYGRGESIRADGDFEIRTGRMANKRKWRDVTFRSTHLV